MSIAMELALLKRKLAQAEITQVEVTDDALIVELADGRTINAELRREQLKLGASCVRRTGRTSPGRQNNA